jgi:hypothetical protein
VNAADGDHTMGGWRRPSANTDPNPPLPEPDGPVDPTVAASPIEEVRPGRFTLMAAGWIPPTQLVTQALGLCFTTDGLVVMVTVDGRQWTLPGGSVEDGESVEQALVREVAEEACARVVRCQYLASTSLTRSTPTAGPATTRAAGGRGSTSTPGSHRTR